MTAQPTTIKKQLTVEAPLERAFSVFTAQMGRWWPKSHHIGKTAMTDCVIEPAVGGRWFERCQDGSECTWGKVLVWEPPRRLVLAWQLDGEFTYDPSLVTEVEVQFVALAPGRTRVDFEHRELERLAAVVAGEQGMDAGWGMILAQYAADAAGAAVATGADAASA